MKEKDFDISDKRQLCQTDSSINMENTNGNFEDDDGHTVNDAAFQKPEKSICEKPDDNSMGKMEDDVVDSQTTPPAGHKDSKENGNHKHHNGNGNQGSEFHKFPDSEHSKHSKDGANDTKKNSDDVRPKSRESNQNYLPLEVVSLQGHPIEATDIELHFLELSLEPHSKPKSNTNHSNQPNSDPGIVIFSDEYTQLSVLTFISILTTLFDVGSDIFVSVLYATKGNWWWFGLTLVFVIGPCVITGFITKFHLIHGLYRYKWYGMLAAVIPGGPIILYIRIIFIAMKARKIGKQAEELELSGALSQTNRLSATLRLYEAMMEAAPQLVLQLYIIIRGKGKTNEEMFLLMVQWISIATSLCSLSWAVAAFYKSDIMKDLSYLGLAFQFIWRICIIGPRVVSLAILASYNYFYLLILVPIHWIFMSSWLFWQISGCVCYSQKELFFSFALGAVNIFYYFCPMDSRFKHTRLKYVCYYAITYVENAAVITDWYLLSKNQGKVDTYHYAVMAVVLGGFFFGIFFQVIYYLKIHRSKDEIKIKVPLKTLSCLNTDE